VKWREEFALIADSAGPNGGGQVSLPVFEPKRQWKFRLKECYEMMCLDSRRELARGFEGIKKDD
jgi:hypothetical protein